MGGWWRRAGEMETLGFLPLAGRMSGFQPSWFFIKSWLNLLLIPEEGPGGPSWKVPWSLGPSA